MKTEEFTLEYYQKKDEEKRARQRKYSSDYYHKNKETFAMNRQVSEEEYKEILEKQFGGCAICTARVKRFCIDHNHETGEIRGLLCRRCNIGLGYFLDDAVILNSAINYLKKYEKDEETAS